MRMARFVAFFLVGGRSPLGTRGFSPIGSEPSSRIGKSGCGLLKGSQQRSGG